MQTKLISAILLLAILLSACSSVTETLSTNPASTPTPQAPMVNLVKLAPVTDSPGPAGCSEFHYLSMGQPVTIIASYNDYANVSYEAAGRTQVGWIPLNSLPELPGGVPSLNNSDIQWTPVVDYSGWTYYSADQGGSLFVDPGIEENSDNVSDPAEHTVPVPLRIRFGMSVDSARWATVKLDGLEHTTGPWWQGVHRMDIFANNGFYDLCVRDGSTENCTAEFQLSLPSDQIINLVFTDENGKTLQVLDEYDRLVQEIDLTQVAGLNLSEGLFPLGWFQFGTSVGPPGTLTVTNLSITTRPSGKFEENWMTEPGLAYLAAPLGIMIGTEFNPDLLTDVNYCRAARHDFNLAYLSVFTNAQAWLGPDEYDFDLLDHQVNETAKLGYTIYASHLVWGAYEKGVLPDWLKKGGYTRTELLNILENHIKTLVTRYKDQVSIWSIANEAPERDVYTGADFWYDRLGPEYIEKSLQWAREADPDAILILNSANNESPRDPETTANIERLYQLVSRLQDKGIKVDAVGMQMHFFLPWLSPIPPKKEDVVATMKRFGDLGVKVMITEMDVNLHGGSLSAEAKLDRQTQLYGDMMSACIESGVCMAFSTWGIGDAYSWITCGDPGCVYGKATPDAAPLMFDIHMLPKPAYYAVRDSLLASTP